MNINEEFPSKYLKSSDLRGSVAKVKIDRVASEDIGGDRKLRQRHPRPELVEHDPALERRIDGVAWPHALSFPSIYQYQ